MRKHELGGCIALLLVGILWAQDKRPFVVLPPGEAPAVNRLCSRVGPKGVDGGWTPEARDIETLEVRLGDIKLKSRVAISSPFGFYRQYVSIVSGGRRLIYVNAFPPDINFKDWKTRLMDVCDGGPAFWGIQFDPVADKFSDLETKRTSH
jgi:hypothetical protein